MKNKQLHAHNVTTSKAKWKSQLQRHSKSTHIPNEYFEHDIKVKIKDEDHHHEYDNDSIKQEEDDEYFNSLKVKKEYFEDDTKPNVVK